MFREFELTVNFDDEDIDILGLDWHKLAGEQQALVVQLGIFYRQIGSLTKLPHLDLKVASTLQYASGNEHLDMIARCSSMTISDMSTTPKMSSRDC